MRKLFSILLVASALASPLAMAAEANAAPQKGVAVKKTDVQKRVVVRKGGWVKGRRLSAADRRRAADIDYRRYRLSTPPPGYHWVRVGDNFLLVGITSGLISSVLNAR